MRIGDNGETKLLAFRLAERQQNAARKTGRKWKVRDGVTIAGCSLGQIFPGGPVDFRFDTNLDDAGDFC